MQVAAVVWRLSQHHHDLLAPGHDDAVKSASQLVMLAVLCAITPAAPVLAVGAVLRIFESILYFGRYLCPNHCKYLEQA